MNVLLIGCGKMGGALLIGWSKGPDLFTIVDPALEASIAGADLLRDRTALGDVRFDAIVVAVKPQLIDAVMPGYDAHLADGGYVLSIAAGASIARLKSVTNDAPVVRIMPNLPAAIGMGVSGLCASADATAAQIAHATAMMERTGSVIEVADEDALDRFTAIAGSGPGYVFEIARAYAMAAIEIGFSEEDALTMVLGTLEGTIAMARRSADSLETLRNSVTSKGGTTAAGLAALNGEDQLSNLLRDTANAAYDRAVELR